MVLANWRSKYTAPAPVPVSHNPGKDSPAPTPANKPAPSSNQPPKYFLFASKISDVPNKYTLSKTEIDQVIKKYGTNIQVMVDVGGRVQPTPEAHDMLTYLKEKKVQHIGVYTEGRTGPTGSSYQGKEMARRRELAPKYNMSDAQWMAGGWEKHFFDQVRAYSKDYGATIFEADNIPEGQTVKFLKSFQAAKDRGALPQGMKMVLKNPVMDSEIPQLKKALADGSVKRESISDYAISEEGYRKQWPALKKGLAEFGIQLATSDNTKKYACKQEYDKSLIGALGRFIKNVGNAVAGAVGAVAKTVGAVLGVKEQKPVEKKPTEKNNEPAPTVIRQQWRLAHQPAEAKAANASAAPTGTAIKPSPVAAWRVSPSPKPDWVNKPPAPDVAKWRTRKDPLADAPPVPVAKAAN